MDDQAADIIADTPAAEPTMIASPEALMRWRVGASPGDSFAYFASSSSLMRERSRSIAADAIAKAVMSMVTANRCVPVQRRNGQGTEYLVQAIDGEPRQAPIVPQPVKVRTRIVQG
jgi:hypothetical protein